MTRRKSVCLKWTLVLLVVVLCSCVHSRPQEASSATSEISVQTDKSTETPIRYRYRNYSISSTTYKLPLHNFVNHSKSDTHPININYDVRSNIKTNNSNFSNLNNHINFYNRTSRMINNRVNGVVKKIYKQNQSRNKVNLNLNNNEESFERKQPAIRKILTKWTDKINDDINFSYETTTSDERYTNLENGNKKLSTKNYPIPQSNSINIYRPRPQTSEETHVYSSNVHILDPYTYGNDRPSYLITPSPSPNRPSYYTTLSPSPNPIITNVGNPKPWSQNSQIYRKPTTQKPLKDYNYHNSVQNYPQYPGNFEVTTFQPTTAYTERIVIRPDEYNASPADCPTIFLTLNNTFQGQGKEACPDLNIAVNTNVINKNVVIESEEEEPDVGFPDIFGLPGGDDSGTEDASNNDYFESDENQADSASYEGTELTNYQAENSPIQVASPETGGYGSASSPSAAISRPGRPNQDNDDVFSFSSIMEYFRPALNAFGWLATLPFGFGLFPILFAPIAFIFAGTSTLAQLFSPWIIPYGREAPKVVHVYRPHWHWDDKIKTWHLHSFPENRKWTSRPSRNSNEMENVNRSVKPTLFLKLKEWMKRTTGRLKDMTKSKQNLTRRYNKRRKRDVWTTRVK